MLPPALRAARTAHLPYRGIHCRYHYRGGKNLYLYLVTNVAGELARIISTCLRIIAASTRCTYLFPAFAIFQSTLRSRIDVAFATFTVYARYVWQLPCIFDSCHARVLRCRRRANDINAAAKHTRHARRHITRVRTRFFGCRSLPGIVENTHFRSSCNALTHDAYRGAAFAFAPRIQVRINVTALHFAELL